MDKARCECEEGTGLSPSGDVPLPPSRQSRLSLSSVRSTTRDKDVCDLCRPCMQMQPTPRNHLHTSPVITPVSASPADGSTCTWLPALRIPKSKPGYRLLHTVLKCSREENKQKKHFRSNIFLAEHYIYRFPGAHY